MPRRALEQLIGKVYPEAGNGRRPYPLSTMLRVHLMQNWFSLSDYDFGLMPIEAVGRDDLSLMIELARA